MPEARRPIDYTELPKGTPWEKRKVSSFRLKMMHLWIVSALSKKRGVKAIRVVEMALELLARREKIAIPGEKSAPISSRRKEGR